MKRMFNNNNISINKKDKMTLFTVNLIIFMVVYGLCFNDLLNCDWIDSCIGGARFYDSFGNCLSEVAQTGRFLQITTYVFHALFHSIGIPDLVGGKWVYQVMMIIIFSIDASLLQIASSKLLKINNYDISIHICTLVLFLNPFYIEVIGFSFPDHSLAILLVIIAIFCYLEDKTFLSILFLFLGCSIYQTYYSLYLIFLATGVLVENEAVFNKGMLKQYARLFFATFTALLLNVLVNVVAVAITNGMEPKGISVPLSIKEVFIRLYNTAWYFLDELYNSFGLLPRGMVVATMIFLGAVVLVYGNRAKASFIYKFLFLVLSVISIPSYGIIITNYYILPRTATVIFCIIFSELLILCFYHKNGIISNRIYKTIAVIVVLFLSINIVNIQNTAADLLVSNRIEKNTCQQIKAEIEEYENESGNLVDTIAVAHYVSPDLYLGTEIFDENNLINPTRSSHFLLRPTWSDVVTLNYYTGSDYSRIDMDEGKIHEFFNELKLEDFQFFNANKCLHFEENVCYWMCY